MKYPYYIPNDRNWRYDLLSPAYIREQIAQANRSLAKVEDDLMRNYADRDLVWLEMRGQWALANSNMMRAYEDRLLKIEKERKQLNGFRKKLLERLASMGHGLDMKKWARNA